MAIKFATPVFFFFVAEKEFLKCPVSKERNPPSVFNTFSF